LVSIPSVIRAIIPVISVILVMLDPIATPTPISPTPIEEETNPIMISGMLVAKLIRINESEKAPIPKIIPSFIENLTMSPTNTNKRTVEIRRIVISVCIILFLKINLYID
jgi:hypothetical protein